MALRVSKVTNYDKGWVNEIGEEEIPAGSAQDVLNFLDMGDRIELIRGQKILGDASVGGGKVLGLSVGTDVAGTEHFYKRVGTKIKKYNTATEVWDDVKTGLTNNEDMVFTNYRTPAGSFIWGSSPTTGLYRCNLAIPSTFTDFYDATKNYKGYPTIEDNRMWLWKVRQNETVLYLSHIDADFPYTAVTNENVGTGTGAQLTFTDTLINAHVTGRSISVTDTVETFTDNGSGVLTGSAGGTGTINYVTGAISVTFNVAPLNLQAILCNYSYEQPKSDGVADFTYSTPRVAGEGAFFFQAKFDDEIQTVVPFDEKFYVLHQRSTWVVDLKADDTDATNKMYREGVGVSSPRSAVPTGEGIYFIDDSQSDNKRVRLLAYNEAGDRVIPKPISDQVNLNDYEFDDCAGVEYGDFILWCARSSSDVSYNDTLILYNKKWNTIDKADGLFRCFAKYGGVLYGGSSVSENVYQLFIEWTIEGSAIEAYWTANEWDLGTEELKKCKYFTVAGEMVESQELIVELCTDGGEFFELGRVAGDGEYVNRASSTEYGVELYGTGAGNYGSGETVTAYEYFRRFEIPQNKFLYTTVRFRTESIGYLNVRMHRFDDVRHKRLRAPEQFR